MMVDRLRIQTEDFSLAEEYQACREGVKGECGAIASFVGLVRDQVNDAQVKGLYLEHYPGMTEASINAILQKARERWEILGITVIHRIGHIASSDQIVLVIVASSHRPDAFAACEFVMDLLKTEAVFWKKEIRSDSDVWIKSTELDFERREGWRELTRP